MVLGYIIILYFGDAILYFTTQVGASVPWDPAYPPPLNQIPFSNSFPANMYKRDTFHVVKHGIGREMAASTLALLSNMGYFDSDDDTKNLPDRLHRGYMLFKLWCGSEKKSPSLKNFTKANLHVTGSPFPYLGGKGSDTTLVLMFLQFYLAAVCLPEIRHADHREILGVLLQMTDGILNFTSIQYSHDLWLPTKCAELMYLEGLVSLRAYNYAAGHCLDLGRALFGLRPKFHLLAETVFEIRASVRKGDQWVLSPVIFNCEDNEDFIGRISRISRHVNTRQCTLRTLQRYGVAFQSKLRRVKKILKKKD